MAKRFIQKAKLKKGALSKQLGIPEKDNIPKTLLKKVVSAKIGDIVKNPTKKGRRVIKATPLLVKRARLAGTLKGLAVKRSVVRNVAKAAVKQKVVSNVAKAVVRSSSAKRRSRSSAKRKAAKRIVKGLAKAKVARGVAKVKASRSVAKAAAQRKAVKSMARRKVTRSFRR